MANKYIEDCGPNAKDYFNDWNYIQPNGYYKRNHVIKGEGELNSCHALDKYPLYDDIYNYIDIGITIFGDNCFNKASVSVVSIPSKLKKIGSNCFEKSSGESSTVSLSFDRVSVLEVAEISY